MSEQMNQAKQYLLSKRFEENDTNLFVYRDGIDDAPTPQAFKHAKEVLHYLRENYKNIVVKVEVIDEWIDFNLKEVTKC